jgi:CIC family chloride channel protein
MQLESVMEHPSETVDPDMELGRMVHQISRSSSTVLPVTDAGGRLLGQIDIRRVRHILFRTELYHHFKASQLMQDPPAILRQDTPMAEVVSLFERTGADHLPVTNVDGILQGYVSRTRMYTQYRKMVADMSQE